MTTGKFIGTKTATNNPRF